MWRIVDRKNWYFLKFLEKTCIKKIAVLVQTHEDIVESDIIMWKYNNHEVFQKILICFIAKSVISWIVLFVFSQ